MVIVLCSLALFSFVYIGGSKEKLEKVGSFVYLQEAYNVAESVKYSGNYVDYQKQRYVFDVEERPDISMGITYYFYSLEKEIIGKGLKIKYGFGDF